MRDLVEREKVACDLTELESVDLFWDQALFAKAVDAVRARHQALPWETDEGLPSWNVHQAAETREKFKAPDALGAISYPGATLSAYKLVRGLLHLALRRGMNLQTNTPVLEILPAPSDLADARERRWVIQTTRGQVLAENVVLATNAYTSHLYPPLQLTILPTRGQVAVQRPGTAFSHSCIPSRSYAFYHADGTQGYMLCRPPGSSGEWAVVVGGGRLKAEGMETGVLDDSAIHPAVSTYLTDAVVEAFGRGNWGVDQPEGRVVGEWSGIMGCTVDGKPFVGEAGGRRRGLWVCAGFNGHGESTVFGGLRCGGADAGGGRYGAVIAVRGGYCMHDDWRRR